MSDAEVGIDRNLPTVPPSMKRNSAARLGLSGARVGFGLGTASVSARVLGPSGKGTLSTLLFVASLMGIAGSLGLGEASTVAAEGDVKKLRHALGASLPAVFIASLCGSAGVWLIAVIADWNQILPAVAVTSLSVPFISLVYFLLAIEVAQERLVSATWISALQLGIDFSILALLLVLLGFGLMGGSIAALTANVITLTVLVVTLRRRGIWHPPRVNIEFLRRAVPMGAAFQGAMIVMLLAQRADLLVVYSLGNEAMAGLYSIALTIGQITTFASASLAAAAFPRVASLDRDPGLRFAARAIRISLWLSIFSALILAAVARLAIPVAFGPGFKASVAPAMILLIGGVIWSAQWTISRMASALGFSRLALRSFGTSFLVMMTLDVILVPRFGMAGAAVASIVGNVMGLVVALRWCREVGLNAVELIPRLEDVRHLGGAGASSTNPPSRPE